MIILSDMVETKTNKLSQLDFVRVVHQHKQLQFFNQQIEMAILEE